MMELLSLPLEILEKITEQLNAAHKKPLRSVCKQLNEVVERQIFANLVLKYSNYQPELICEQLEALATRTTNARKYVRSLEIRGFSPDAHLGARSRSRSVERNRNSRSRSRGPLAETHVANKCLLAHLGQAICSLHRVHSVWWHFSPNDPEWAQSVIMDSLACFPFLEELRISLGGGSASSLKLEQLANLRKITVTGFCTDYRADVIPGLQTLISNSPNLTHLDINSSGSRADSDTSTLHDLLGAASTSSPLCFTHLSLRSLCIRLDAVTLPHLRSLESLLLCNTIDTRQDALSHLDDSVREELAQRTEDYCSSNEEIWDKLREERIHLKEITTDEVNDAFLEYLASYSGLNTLTLTAVAAEDPYASNKLAVKFYRDVLPRHAQTLVSLDISPVYEGKWCFGRHNISSILQYSKLARLKVSINSEDIRREKDRDVIWTLLEIANDLPYLSYISISSADSENNRGGRWADPSIVHLYRVNKEISKSVTTFGPLDPTTISKVITTPARDYIARSDEDAGPGLWYRSSMSQGSQLDL